MSELAFKCLINEMKRYDEVKRKPKPKPPESVKRRATDEQIIQAAEKLWTSRQSLNA